MGFPVLTSCSRTVPSAPEVTSTWPSGVNCIDVNRCTAWPSKRGPTGFQLLVDHSCAVPSMCPVASRVPSGEKASERPWAGV